MSKAVRKTMNRVLKYQWGNPSAGYQKGKTANGVIKKAREQVANAINGHPHEIYFTSCATEANNMVLKLLSDHFYPTKTKIITSPIEHSSVLKTLEYLKTKGIDVQYCPVDQYGFVLVDELKKQIDDNTFLICCMLANNEIGTIQNIRQITALAKKHSVLVMSDCVQAFGKIPIDVKELGVDYATFSAHKLYGPKGVGALYAKISSPVAPFIHGGHQEEGMRGGTESVHNIAGFGKACQLVPMLIAHSGKTQLLKAYFIQKLKKAKSDIIINSPTEHCLPNTISVSFPGINSRELMMMLDYHGISVSAGSACNSQQNKPSHVLQAIGLNDKAAQETLRISFGKDTKKGDINYIVRIFTKYLRSAAN